MYAKVDYVKLRALFALSERPKLTNIDLTHAFLPTRSIGQQEHLDDDGVVGFVVADWKIEQQQQHQQQQELSFYY
ncbi:hypothetical protein T4D_14203 [Trichinella pseudospiralis]|uniref:Uncharacterized protein n=1 Tax=Trichinella pseudospiralis TaxID=6337 RepID=A0A0V1F4Y0_TRIPS|nr:hypothetical protein T4D_14203 [Trichinella pseudospiralis]